jgi:hypothetical protein
VTIDYIPDGATAPIRTITETLQDGQTRLHYQANDGLPVGFHGSALVTTGANTGTTGVANVLAVGQTAGDWLMTYEGVSGPWLGESQVQGLASPAAQERSPLSSQLSRSAKPRMAMPVPR